MTTPLILLALTLTACVTAGWRLWLRLRPLAYAQPAARFDAPAMRIGFALAEVGLHRRLLNLRLSGIIHILVFFSFIVLLTAILQSYFKAFLPQLVFPHSVAVLQDVFSVLMLLGIVLALYNRLVRRPARFRGSNAVDAYFVLAMITTIVVAMQLEFVFEVLAGKEIQRPIATLLAAPLRPWIDIGTAHILKEVFYWIHVVVILAFLVYLPGSKHLHMFAGIPNIIFRNRAPRGRLPEARPPAQEPEPARITDLPWKGMLDLYSCTECGRCQAVCPAYSAGLPLSPKTLIMDLRNNLVDVAANGSTAEPIAGPVISEDTLWACTTCAACMEVCPLYIEHVPKIIDMRRSLVDEGNLQPLLQQTLVSFQKYGNSFKKPAKQRPNWTKTLDFDIPNAAEEAVDILWYVGDYASYHPLVAMRTKRVAELLHAAGVNFGILYDQERNAGNDIRRVGEEGLFQELAADNIATLRACTFNRIMTTDPHTLNTLVNEYPELGFSADVIHHTQLLHELMEEGRLAYRNEGEGRRVTYHDPCYLGRYNGRFEAPRSIISRLGYDLQDMPRCRENSFCCGAGGGRIFMEDATKTERPSESRIREALDIRDVKIFVVACPKDVVMYTAAVENLNVADRIAVKEISELFVTA